MATCFPLTVPRRCCGTAACLHNSTEVYLYSIYRVRIPRSEEAGLHAFDSEQGLASPNGSRLRTLRHMLVLNVDSWMHVDSFRVANEAMHGKSHYIKIATTNTVMSPLFWVITRTSRFRSWCGNFLIKRNRPMRLSADFIKHTLHMLRNRLSLLI